MRILCTGGAGYLGSTLVPMLLEASFDYQIEVVDSFMWRQNSLAHVCHNPRLTITRADVRDFDKLAPSIEKADVIIPLAALVGAPLCDADPLTATSVNVEAVRGMLAMARRDAKVIIPISNSGYGVGEAGKFCTEETPMRPVSLYGRTKVDAEYAAMTHGNTISLRLATVFGMSPRMRLDLLVNDFVYRAVHDKALVLFEASFKRNYIHVRDVARAFIHSLKYFDKMKGHAYNVGLSSANLSKRELCEAIQQRVPKFWFTVADISYDPDKRDYIVSNDKIEATGWRPQHSLKDGIDELVKGYEMIRNTVHGNV